VPPQSPAAAAGIRPGDVILELDGKPTPALADLLRLSAAAPQFGSVGISVWRAQRSVQLHAEAPLR
jgi:S1-C subfamily serine protease